MVDALKYFNAETATDEPANGAYTISNVDAEGNIVPLYTGIALDHAYSVEDIVGFYDISDIGSSRNLETHIFQIFAEDGPTDTVEWVAMNNASMSAFVPYNPMLTTDTYAGYLLSTAEAVFTEEEPAGAEVYYATTTTVRTDEGRETVEGYRAAGELGGFHLLDVRRAVLSGGVRRPDGRADRRDRRRTGRAAGAVLRRLR